MSAEAVRSELEGMALRLSALGCSDAEIDAVRRDQGVELPWSYECFLRAMGRDVGGLFGGSDINCREVLGLRQAARALLEENQSQFTLPDDAVVFCMHQGYQFEFLHGSEGPDPSVWWWTEVREDTLDAPVRIAGSLYEHLRSDERRHVLEASHRRSTQAIRRLQFAQETCPECGGVMAWLGVIRFDRSMDNSGRHTMEATCHSCGSRYARWADNPDEPLIPLRKSWWKFWR